MAKVQKTKDAKESTLKTSRCLNPHPERVHSEAFRAGSFFDARDLVQVKYEMLREVDRNGASISDAAKVFGMSRPSFYLAKSDFESGGIPGLAGQKRGPKRAHKITDEILEFIEGELEAVAEIDSATLSRLVQKQFMVKIHPRSIERALDRKKKRASNAGVPT